MNQLTSKPKTRRFFFILLMAAFSIALQLAILAAGDEVSAEGYGGGVTARINTDSSGGQANNAVLTATDLDISADGRYVVFASTATNLVAEDTNGYSDIFLKDSQTGGIIKISTDSSGNQASGPSFQSAISANGRYVVFSSIASNLVPGDTNGNRDIFVKDTSTGTTTRVSTNSTDGQASAPSGYPDISADGRLVTFSSYAVDLVPADTNGRQDIFLKDTQTGSIARVSSTSSDVQANDDCIVSSISHDGRYVCFVSYASNLVSNDSNAHSDVFIKDVQTGQLTRVSTDSAGSQSNGSSSAPSLSADGSLVIFSSDASNLISDDTNAKHDIFVKFISTGTITRVSTDSEGKQVNGFSNWPDISADGRYITFNSDANNLVAYDFNNNADIFIKDTSTGEVNLVSTDSDGRQGNDNSGIPIISGDGQFITFFSDASNLVVDDTNDFVDIFIAGNLPNPLPQAFNYYFPWYDSQFGKTWVLGAVPQSDTAKSLDVYLRNMNSGLMDLLTPSPLIVDAGETKYLEPNGLMGGPVMVLSHEGKSLVSERSLFGNSFEEIWATPYDELDSRYYWPTYVSFPGMQTWILVSNPLENNEQVQVDLTIKTLPVEPGQPDPPDVGGQKILNPGASWAPSFADTVGMPVEVKAYRVGGSANNPADARKVVASERILVDGSFNEMPGIPANNLSDRYFWTWYDSVNGQDVVVVGNPSPTNSVWVVLSIGSRVEPAHELPPGMVDGWMDPGGVMDGPVEIRGCADQQCSAPADLFTSQQVFLGNSYEETAGTPTSDLSPATNWTWYDMKSPGVTNWVLIANPNEENEIYWELTIPGGGANSEGLRAYGNLAPGARTTPTLAGVMGGPVQVKAWAADSNKTVPMDVMASQRVLWNGYFNEIVGKGL